MLKGGDGRSDPLPMTHPEARALRDHELYRLAAESQRIALAVGSIPGDALDVRRLPRWLVVELARQAVRRGVLVRAEERRRG